MGSFTNVVLKGILGTKKYISESVSARVRSLWPSGKATDQTSAKYWFMKKWVRFPPEVDLSICPLCVETHVLETVDLPSNQLLRNPS